VELSFRVRLIDNENHSQSRYSNISNMVQGGVYIYESESIAIRNWNISEYGSEHRKAMCTGRVTQECYVGTWDRTGTRIRTGTGTGTKLKTAILRSVLVIPEFEHRTKFQESRESV